jgi:hypothetical protein
MFPNINEGVGVGLMQMLVSICQKYGVNTTGHFFIVGASSLSQYNELSYMFAQKWPDGTSVLFTTLAAASAACVAGRGDVIFVMAGHTENISSSTALTLSISGVSIIGLGTGNNRPIYTLDTATTSTINVTANNITIANMIFQANFANIAALFTLTTATDFRVQSCEIRDKSAILNFLGIVTTDSTSNHSDGLVIDTCIINLLATSGAVYLYKPTGTNDRVRISNNYFIAQSTNAAAVIPIATGKILTNFLLLNNHFNLQNATGTATGYIITTNGSTNTGFIDGNIDHALPTSPLFCTASSGFVYGANYHSDQADLQGYLVPAADS